jgi:hypothetical protein
MPNKFNDIRPSHVIHARMGSAFSSGSSLSLYPSAFIPPHHYLIYECDNNKNENKNENKNKQHSPPPPPK